MNPLLMMSSSIASTNTVRWAECNNTGYEELRTSASVADLGPKPSDGKQALSCDRCLSSARWCELTMAKPACSTYQRNRVSWIRYPIKKTIPWYYEACLAESGGLIEASASSQITALVMML